MNDAITAVLEQYHTRRRAERDAMQRGESLDRDKLLLAVGPDTGQLLNALVRSLEAPLVVEVGTSYGYSSIWLGAAAQAAGGRVITLELQAYKAQYAREKALQAGLDGVIEHRVGDALALLPALPDHSVDFVLLDLWKDLYVPCLDALLPKLAPGAMIAADNILRPGGPPVQRYQQRVRQIPGMTSVLLPIGTGVELSRLEG